MYSNLPISVWPGKCHFIYLFNFYYYIFKSLLIINKGGGSTRSTVQQRGRHPVVPAARRLDGRPDLHLYGRLVEQWLHLCRDFKLGHAAFSRLRYWCKRILKVSKFLNIVSKKDQLRQIFRVCGSPNETEWPNVRRLPDYRPFTRYQRLTDWTNYVPQLDDIGQDLLKKLLVCPPGERLSAEQALMHPYFNLLNNKS